MTAFEGPSSVQVVSFDDPNRNADILTIQLHQFLTCYFGSFFRVIFIVDIGTSIDTMLAVVLGLFSFTDKVSESVNTLEM